MTLSAIAASGTAARLICTGLLVAVSAAELKADVTLPAMFADHMMLQRETEAPIWGWAQPGEKITVSADWLNAPVVGQADDHGEWMLRIPTPKAGGPCTLFITGKNSITINDVMIGEVWICSGQSNMEMPVNYVGPGYWGVIDYEKEIAAADYPDIRLFTVQRTHSIEPQDDCIGQWRRCNPETVGAFSAVGYFFGRDLHEDMNIPIGLICTAWGGTPAEAWTSYAALEEQPNWVDALREVDMLRDNADVFEIEYQKALARWKDTCRIIDTGLRDEWMKPGYDDSKWKRMAVPGGWQGEDLGNFDGVAWFRTRIKTPRRWEGKELVLELGPIDDWDVTYINGERIGAHDSGNVWQKDRVYTIPENLIRPGRNVIAVRVIDTGGGGGIHGEPGQLKIHVANDNDGISLAGQWRYAIGASMRDLPGRPSRKTFRPRSPSALFNGMIAPLTPYAIRGAIWYQGEANRYDPVEYRSLFPAMIQCWRDEWKLGDFPFYFVQIAPFDYGLHGATPSDATAELREAQFMALSSPNTGMAVTMDVGNPRDIHPRNKQPVGERLALWAKAKTYGDDSLVHSGPLYRSMKIEDDRVRLCFDHVGSGLAASGAVLTHFTIAGEDGEFVTAQAKIEGETVVVWSEDVTAPVAVRYAWTDAPDPNLFNKEGLPASSFRTNMP